jgi:dipeptidyl aminopeptidase/acylaminoacyl peptidase
MRFFALFCLIAALAPAFAQKKELDASVYDSWKRVGDIQLSNNGRFSAYTVRPYRGDGFLVLVDNQTGKTDSVARGLDPQFSAGNTYLVFRIGAGFDTLRKSELNKVSKDKWPKDSLGIWFLASDSLVKIPNLKDYRLSAKSDWLAWLSTNNELPKGYLTKKEAKKEKKQLKKNGPVKSDGKLLTVWHPEVKKEMRYMNVNSYTLSDNGAYLAFTEQRKYKKDSVQLNVLSTNDRKIWQSRRYTEFSQLSFGETAGKLTGFFSSDTTERKRWNAFWFDCAGNSMNVFADTSMRFERDRTVTNSFRMRFSEDERRLFFGVWDAWEPEPKDTLLENEKVKLDIWHWKDERIQPQQLVELSEDETDFNLHVYHLDDQRFVQLGKDSFDLRLPSKGPVDYVLASSDEQYAWQSWLTPTPANYYRISTDDGQVELLRENVMASAYLSPKGRYFVFFEEKRKQLMLRDLQTGTETCLTCKAKASWLEDVNGMPVMASPLGIAGWTTNENGVLLQSRKDVYLYDLNSDKLENLTAKLFKIADTNYRHTLRRWSEDSVYYDPQNCFVEQFNELTKAEAYYSVSGTFDQPVFEKLAGSDHHYTGWKKARYAATKVFQRQSVTDYPDLYLLAAGKEPRRISYANPQQKDYNWATVELVKWRSYEGIPLEGLLYKPENFDPNEEYPMIVYFYELYSDELHVHSPPRPTASIIFPTEYASAGYLVFIPDIRYKPGHPANSAYDCIMSGTDAMLKKYPNIDAKRLGLQGQSWGGYQTAQLITMTDRYAAAMAGAPVGNMFSAYGGIRWGSGFSRQFQYEHTQSRIGKTMWEAPQLYIENSPVFHLPKVKTPLLIMHNDKDGAVPWYQGIEIYTGLRRLQKPVWLLNYNGDDHNLMKPANRMDLSIRMRQFFDHYLLEKPAPKWLSEGLPALEKGKELRLELAE